MLEQVIFASGPDGPEPRADGKGGFLERGWYMVRFNRVFGPFATERAAEAALLMPATSAEVLAGIAAARQALRAWPLPKERPDD